jgi:hypothetical protein
MAQRAKGRTATMRGPREELDERDWSVLDRHPALDPAGIPIVGPQPAGGVLVEMLRREVRVAFSRQAQPVWFRVTKWTVFLTISVLAWRTGHIRSWLLGGAAAGLGAHLLWRRNTRGWTRPWGGWNDLDAGRRR